jgi:hypothetical protein
LVSALKPLAFCRIEVGRQADTVIANRHPHERRLRPRDRYPYRFTGPVGIGVPGGVQNQFVDDERHEDRAVRSELDLFGRFKL